MGTILWYLITLIKWETLIFQTPDKTPFGYNKGNILKKDQYKKVSIIFVSVCYLAWFLFVFVFVLFFFALEPVKELESTYVVDIKLVKRPFYSTFFICLAFEWKWGLEVNLFW